MEEKTAPINAATPTAVKSDLATPVASTPVAPTPVAPTPVAPQSTQPEQPKTLAPAAPSEDASTSGILSMDDLKGAELSGVDFAANASSEAKPESVSETTSVPVTSKARTELRTETINASNRDCLTSIAGIDDAIQHSLFKAGYLSFSDLSKASEREIQLALSKHNHRFTNSDFTRWRAQAALASRGDWETFEKQEIKSTTFKTVLNSTESATPPAQADDFTKIRGIGPATADLLRASGITTFSELSQAGTPRLQEILDGGGAKFAVVDPSMWCRQAGFAMSSSKPRVQTETVAIQPASTADSTPADSTPEQTVNPVLTASTAPQDDLTKIAGIGPETQQILRANGIQQFEQMAGMTADQLKEFLATQESRFQSLDPTSWPVQARALTTRLSEESDVLAEVNSIIDLAKNSAAKAKSDSSTTDVTAEKATSEQ